MKFKLAALFTLCLVALARAEVPTTQPLAPKLDAILTRLADKGAVVSARVIDADSGDELYSRDADVPKMPASNMKLISTAIVLDQLGAKSTLDTRLAIQGKDLWLIGTGDPSTGDNVILKKYGKRGTDLLDAWADEMKAAGISKIEGALKFYDGALEDKQVGYTWELDDLQFWYAAPIGGLNFNDNCIDINVFPTDAGKPGRFELYPLIEPATEVINQSSTIAEGTETWDAGRYPLINAIWIKGTIRKTREESCPVLDPGLFFAQVLRERLKLKGIEVTGPIERAAKLPEAFDKEFTPIRSKLPEVLKRTNKDSQNLLAEGLSKLAGRAFEQKQGHDVPGSWKNAAEAAHDFFSRNQIDDSALVLDDGSGLSRNNRVTVHILSDLLRVMHKHKDGEAFFDSLSIAGVDGTSVTRFKDTPNRVFAKTGYIRGVRSYTGYVKTDSGKLLIFSIIYNNIPGPVRPYQELQDEAVMALMKL